MESNSASDLMTGDAIAGAVQGYMQFFTPMRYGIHDTIGKLFWSESNDGFTTFSNSSSLIFQCGCYDGEGYSIISPKSDPSACFINGILMNIISLLLIIIGTRAIVKLRQEKNISSKKQFWFPLKLVLVFVQIIFQIVLTFSAASVKYPIDGVSFINDIKFWSTVVSFVALLVAFVLHFVENYKTYVPNDMLVLYWLFSSIIGGFKVWNLSLRNDTSNALHFSALAAVNSLIILFIETSFPPPMLYEPLKQSNPLDYADILSRLTFTWMTPLMSKGYKQFLVQSDLPALPKYLKSEVLSDVFLKNWNKELKYKTKPSLAIAVAKSFGGPFLLAGLFKIIQDCIAFVQPQLLKQLIIFVTKYNEDPETPLTRGFIIVLAMFGFSVLQTASLHQYFQRVFDTGMKVKSSLTSVVYQKSLNLSVEAKQKKSTGDIVNLMSVDTQRLQDLMQNLNIIWSGPFQITLCLVSLYNLLGNAMWIGVAVLLFTFPLNTMIFRYQRKLQTKQMGIKDERTGLISEILNNIKSLKLYSWEDPYKERLNHVRNEKELANLKKIGSFQAFGQFVFNCSPFIVSSSTFAVFLMLYKDITLTSDIVFTALSLFNLLSFPLAVLPWTIGNIIESQVSIQRLTEFLASDEIDDNAIVKLEPATHVGDVSVNIEDADFLWTREPYKISLTNINYTANKGELSCVIGKVGSGKSALIQSILGDLHKSKGIATLRGSVAYVPQVAWIMNGTIKENILFGCRFDPVFYDQTIKACALTHDLSILPDGDQTQVGEKGISLSGGQKARLSLARAVYARADIYLLDDVLSAVDEHVGKHLINNVLGSEGLLRTKCRILATNNLTVLKFSDKITMVGDGKIIEESTYESATALGSQSNLTSLLRDFGNASTPQNESSVNLSTIEKGSSVSSDLDEEIRKVASRRDSLSKASLEDFQEAIDAKEDEASKKKTGFEESHEQGKVKRSVYGTYAKACGMKNVVILLLAIAAGMSCSVFANVWLKHWSDLNTRLEYNPEPFKYLAVYFCLCIGSAFFTLVQTLVQWLKVSIHGSKYLHSIMLDSVLRAPMSFFETTPIGRILNRFSNDIYKIDENLARVFAMFFSNSIKVTFTIFVIIYSTWQFVFLIFPLTVLYLYYQKFYLATSRELRRLDSVSRSPIFAHFQETLTGVATIRAYNQLDRFQFLNQHKMDTNMSAYHPSVSSNRWLAVRLEFLGSIIILGASGLLIVTLSTGKTTAGLVGLSVSYALQITQSLNWIVRMTVEIESNIVSVERVIEYSELTPEAPEIIEDHRPPTHWPFNGSIEFKNYSTRYRPELSLVLKNINLEIKPHEKIGIVGRTGAGKSSLTMALFRIIEAAGGYIDIDNINTSELGLRDLRRHLSIIPQDSQVFQGTLKDNLDPTNKFSDEEIWKALELSHLKDHVMKMYEDTEAKESLIGPLYVKLSEGGSNLSVGQRQLICLARALLIESHVLVLDEATAAVDVQTDSILQSTIRTEFKDRTILTIAHRLNTIIDSDRIIVLEKGEVAEFDTPAKLLENKDSLFYSLCKEGGLVSDDDQLIDKE